MLGTYVSEVTIVDQLHLEKDVEEDLALGNLGDLSGAFLRAVKLLLIGLASLEPCRLARQLKALVEIREVELDDEDDVGKLVRLAQLFELFG